MNLHITFSMNAILTVIILISLIALSISNAIDSFKKGEKNYIWHGLISVSLFIYTIALFK